MAYPKDFRSVCETLHSSRLQNKPLMEVFEQILRRYVVRWEADHVNVRETQCNCIYYDNYRNVLKAVSIGISYYCKFNK